MASERSEARKISQLNTPKEWILDGRMFRIKSWEIEEKEIHTVVDSLVKHEFKINVIRGKDGVPKGITLLYLSDPEDVEIIRTNLLITETCTELRKISQLSNPENVSRTIKTTAPLWISKERILKVFSKYNSDPDSYDFKIDGVKVKGVKYPIVRFYPTTVDRDTTDKDTGKVSAKKTKVNVVYVEFSPKEKCKYDSFIALSMEHRVPFYNSLSQEKATLIFDKWTVDKVTTKKTEGAVKAAPEVRIEEVAESKVEVLDKVVELCH